MGLVGGGSVGGSVPLTYRTTLTPLAEVTLGFFRESFPYEVIEKTKFDSVTTVTRPEQAVTKSPHHDRPDTRKRRDAKLCRMGFSRKTGEQISTL